MAKRAVKEGLPSPASCPPQVWALSQPQDLLRARLCSRCSPVQPSTSELHTGGRLPTRLLLPMTPTCLSGSGPPRFPQGPSWVDELDYWLFSAPLPALLLSASLSLEHSFSPSCPLSRGPRPSSLTATFLGPLLVLTLLALVFQRF